MKWINNAVKSVYMKPGIELAVRRPGFVPAMRLLNDIQLSSGQLKYILQTLKKTAPCRLLVFGLGYDSLFWHTANRGGVTVFIEDDEEWFRKITRRYDRLTAFLVNYNSQRRDWKKLMESPGSLDMTLPDSVGKESWDVILVDGPAGWNDDAPGRMKSIFQASRLVKNSGDVFVHDCQRKVEDIYCGAFLKKENLKIEIRSPHGFLRHYIMQNHGPDSKKS